MIPIIIVYFPGGSFRQFLHQVACELQSTDLGLLMPVPSSATQSYQGYYLIQPGHVSYSEQKILQFIGQVLTIVIALIVSTLILNVTFKLKYLCLNAINT